MPAAEVTSTEVRAWSLLDFAAFGYTTGSPDPLDLLVARATEYVLDATGYSVYSDVPDRYALTWGEAVQRRTEQLVIKSQEDEIETAGDFDLIKSFGAGNYNEARRDMGDVEKGKVVNPWPLLDDLLKRMMTDDKRDEWLELWGVVVPAFAMTEVDWNGTFLTPPDSDYFE